MNPGVLASFVVMALSTFAPASAEHARGASDLDRSDRPPPGLTSSDWSSIRAAYEANRHAAVAVEGGYVARNPGQHWRTRFDGRGFLVTPDDGAWAWGLELVSFGRAGDERVVESPGCMDAQGQRVEYEWDDSLTEWYVNDRRGLEHGYTIHRRPDAGRDSRSGGCERGFSHQQALNITLAVRGGLRPQVSGNGHDVTFVDVSGAAVLNYHGLRVFDADGRSLPAHFESSDDALRLTIDDAGARYPLTVDPIAQQAYLKASNAGLGDEFGYSVAVSGDTVVIGAPGEASSATVINGNQADNSASDSGAAFVFVRSGTTWSQQAYLKASNAEANDMFGFSVAVSGDTVVVGAYREDSSATGIDGDQADNSAPFSGAAYVFVRNDGDWSQQAYLKASNTGAGDFFARSVAVSGDTVLVGAPREDGSATGIDGNQADNKAPASGAAYVFVRSGSVWSQQAYLKASNTGNGDEFGYSVAVDDETLVVGAIWEDSSATGVNGNQADKSAFAAGAAYVFGRDGTSWSQQAYVKASNTGAGDQFGSRVAVSGDTVVVGARWEASSATGIDGDQADNSAPCSGAAYAFVRNPGAPGSWSQQAYLKASNTGAGDQFGWSLAVSGDTVVVGAHMEDSSATGIDGNQADSSAADSGAAYVFVRSSGAWGQLAYLKASNTGANDNFGSSVAVSGDTVLAGASGEASDATGVNGNQANNGAVDSGAAYVFTGFTALPGDCDGDGDVDLANYAAFPACTTGPAAGPPAPPCGCFDINLDDAVDLLDFAEIQNAFTG